MSLHCSLQLPHAGEEKSVACGSCDSQLQPQHYATSSSSSSSASHSRSKYKASASVSCATSSLVISHSSCNKYRRRPSVGGKRLTKEERSILCKLSSELRALRSVLPEKHSCGDSSIVADALKYKHQLKQEIRHLLLASPRSEKQVIVCSSSSGCLRISITCEKKDGLLVQIMDAMESFGLIFSQVKVSCKKGISIDAVASQVSARIAEREREREREVVTLQASSHGVEVQAMREALLQVIGSPVAAS